VGCFLIVSISRWWIRLIRLELSRLEWKDV
jgi:hypothetical protein